MSFPVKMRHSQPMQAPGAFQNTHDCVFNNPQFVSTTTDDGFMEKFAGYTIRGAELDSSARDPPPRCHPGTRKGIVNRMHIWFRNPFRTKRILWLVGPAGVGKSAIMQTVAEVERKKSIFAALFFSAPNGRNDPSKVITTLAYQLAARYPPYLDYVRTKIRADPKVLEKSIIGQFNDFIVEPFVVGRLYQETTSILIFIDGLDECNGRGEQKLILGLISYFTVEYPNVPLLWVIASRPEDHITHYLSRLRLASCFDKEEVSVDTTEACQDVERFLRSEFTKIRSSNSVMSLYPNWPPENLLLDLFAAGLGHFAYADTAIRFIRGGNPVTRLQLIIDLVQRPTSHQASVEGTQPMARLDALYGYIVSQIAPDDLPHTKEILSYLLFPLIGFGPHLISFVCDWLGMTPDTMYSALRELHSVLEIPLPNKPSGIIRFHHKSFADSLLRMKIPGLPIDFLDADKWHISRTIHHLNRVPICNSLTAPEIPWSFSWTYGDSKEFERAEELFSAALSRCIYRSGVFLIQPVNTRTVHASKIAAAHSMLPLHYKLPFLKGVFDDSSALARHLREDGSLRDIPVGLLDIGCIQSETVLVFSYNGDIKYKLGQDFFRIINAFQEMPGTLVKAFITSRLRGWIDVTAICLTYRDMGLPDFKFDGGKRKLSEVSRIVYEYNFSTIYATMMGGIPGE